MVITHPDNEKVSVTWERITREKATEYLQNNSANRPLREKNLRKIKRDLVAGRWNNENPDPIVFNAQGVLDNGQHRLVQVVSTGVPIVSLVVRGVNSGVMRTLDSGAKRCLTDTLRIENERDGANHRNLTHIAGVVVGCMSFDQKGDLRIRSGGADISSEEQYQYFSNNPAYFNDLTSWAKSMNGKARTFKNVATLKRLAIFRYALERGGANQQDVYAFFEKLCVTSAEDVPKSILLLRERLEKTQHERKSQNKEVGQDQVMAWFIKTWNAFICGEDLKIIVYRPGGQKPEKFPTLICSVE